MEALEDSNCPSMSDSFSLYERYLRTFNVVDSFLVKNQNFEGGSTVKSNGSVGGLLHHDNFDLPKDVLSNINSTLEAPFSSFSHAEADTDEFGKKVDSDLHPKASSPCHPFESGFLMENSSITGESNFTEKSENTDVPVSSEDSKSNSKHPKPVIITSLITMENSNNAVDSVPMFRDVRPSETVFKLPIRELTFNGTLKHVQKLKPIVDPLRALTSANNDLVSELEMSEQCDGTSGSSAHSMFLGLQNENAPKMNDTSNERSVSENNRSDEVSESTGDSQYEELKPRVGVECPNDDSNVKWSLDQSYSSLEASFDSGVRSPDMFSDDEDVSAPETENFWDFLRDFEAKDKFKVKRMEETLQGVLPPPSVTTLKIDVTGMLKKYYGFLPAFNDDANTSNPEINSTTPRKLTSLVKIPIENELADPQQEMAGSDKLQNLNEHLENPVKEHESVENHNLNSSKSDSESRNFLCKEQMCSEAEVREKAWPDILKCRFYDVHYNLTKFSERMEMLAQKCGERFVGVETDSSITVYSGGLQSPNSASKRKALRLKLAQAKSPGRRLSHLARRRQAFCSAATLGEKAHTSKMVFIDKNFFPHRKLVNTSERKSPRLRRTPGKRTPGRKTPLKKTPSKTPKTKSGGSSRKKAMRRLLMDPDSLTRSQPTRETSKRALFISPENRKTVPQVPCTSVPLQAMKSKRALFGSPIREAETKSLDGTISDQFLKRKRDVLDDIVEESKSKIAKSLSFGGDSMNPRPGHSLSRRASEMFTTKSNMAELDEHHRKKLLWAVSEALRSRGWRMQSPGFRDKASALAQLTRRLLTLPVHAARLHAPTLSTSDTLYKIAKQYVFAIIQGRTVEECFQEEQNRLANEENKKISGYISATAYQQLRNKPATATHMSSQIKENNCIGIKQEQARSVSKNILQDKLLNVDANSNSSGMSLLDKTGLYKSNSMPSFEEAAKMRARRQISFDNVDFPKR